MAPRRSSARGSSATPAQDVSPSRRSTRGTSRGPSGVVVNNPKLPDIYTEQSFAYGSSTIPELPEQLIARGRMTLQQMAETIDIGIGQANVRFEEQAAAAAAFGHHAQAEARAERARRRSESRDTKESSVQSSREGSVDSGGLERQSFHRLATTWPGNNTDLDDIAEEHSQQGAHASSELNDQGMQSGGDGPSTFPAGALDQSFEFPAMRSRHVHDEPFYFHRFAYVVQRVLHGVFSLPGLVCRDIRNLVAYIAVGDWHFIDRTPWNWLHIPLRGLGYLTAMAILLSLAWFFTIVFCRAYQFTYYDINLASAVHYALRTFCAACAGPAFAPQRDLPAEHSLHYASVVSALGSYRQRLDAVDAENSDISATLKHVLQQQHDVEDTVSKMTSRRASGRPLPLELRVNYCSPGSGAVIDPYLTSPTKEDSQLSLLQRFASWSIGLKKHETNSPSAALRPWEDIGDCWCAAPTNRHIQLGVLMGHRIFPQTVVIEHLPWYTTTNPNSAPKDIEVWADFSHLSIETFTYYGLDKLPNDPTLGHQFVRVGTGVFDMSEMSGNIQSINLEINQHDRDVDTQKLVFRVTSNYGEDYTCLYRVRAHGSPVVAHAKDRSSVNGIPQNKYS